MNLITLDWETYFDADHTLKKLSITEYVRHADFQIHGVGIKQGSRKPAWHTGDKLFDKIHDIDWDNTALLCHHAQFDAFILTHWFRVKPAYYYCSLSMARALLGPAFKHDLDSLAEHFGIGRKIADVLDQVKGKRVLEPKLMRALGAYCRQDVELTWTLFKQHLLPKMPTTELGIIDETVRMYAEPLLRIDSDKVKRYWVLERQKKRRLLKRTKVDEAIVQSNPKFAEALEALHVDIPYKVSPRTGEKTFAFAQDDIGFKMLARHRDKRVQTLVKARLACKSTIGETRAQRLLRHADGTTLPVYYNYYGAHTGRHSGGDKINLQNLENGTDLRRSILAPEGFLLAVGDSKCLRKNNLAF